MVRAMMSGGRPESRNKRRRAKRRPDTGSIPPGLTEKVKTARGRKLSSKIWIERQINDPYVAKARRFGYRSRSAFKLIDLDEKFKLIDADACIVDLGCAPGGWLQVALERGAERVIGIDVLPVMPVVGADIFQLDFMTSEAQEQLKYALDGPANIILSDMAANTTGHRRTDHLQTVALVEAAVEFALAVLALNGHFVAKVFQGGAEDKLLKTLKQRFKSVRHFKPKSSRDESPEVYLVATGFRV